MVFTIFLLTVLKISRMTGSAFHNVYIYPTCSPKSGCGTRSIFKQSKTGLNSVFFFLTGCLTKAKEPCLLCCL